MVFQAASSTVDYDRIIALIEERLTLVPRYRQRVMEVPGRLANPLWVDDPAFDVTYHVRQAALPRPGSDRQLEEFVTRISPRPLDRNRPLWEAYIVEGMENGRFAIVTKTHPALVDGAAALDLAHVILTEDPGAGPEAAGAEPVAWRPRRLPNTMSLVTEAVGEMVRRPMQVVETLQSGVHDVAATGGRVLAAVGEVASTLLQASARPAPSLPLNGPVGSARRFVMVGTDLADYRDVRSRLMKGRRPEEVTVNDVILATLAGALRTWLLTRGEAVTNTTTVRALVPVSVHTGDDDERGHHLSAFFVDLPVGEPNPRMRLHQIAYAMHQQTDAGRAVGARSLSGLARLAPPTMPSPGARIARMASRRLYNLAVTNVPGPQRPRYALGARLLATYPVLPLSPDQALAIGLTSYDGGVYYGLHADRDTVPDVDVLGRAIVDALAELREAPRLARSRGTIEP